MKLISLLSVLSLLRTCVGSPYEEYILAPSSRTLHPQSVYGSNGTVSNPESLTKANGSAVFQDVSNIAFDFGVNIAGLVTLTIGSVSDSDQSIGVTFSESSLWISNLSSDATADEGRDEILWFKPSSPGRYSAPADKNRGGFRYLSLVHNKTGSVEVTGLEVHFTAMPHWAEDTLRNYTGYFHTDDELLNRIWYAGAYTNQLCTIDPQRGNALVHLREEPAPPLDATNITWWSNYTITNGTSALVDGAKRDRLVWAGDMSIAVPGIVVSTNDIITIENSLNSLFDLQNTTTGQLPYAGRPFPEVLSFTYHLYTLIGIGDHFMYTAKADYLKLHWGQYKKALNFSLSFIDSSGLMNVTSPNDWLRFGMGGHNIEANAILYYTINQAITLATAINDNSSVSAWQATADKIKTSANALLWKEDLGMYIDNETTTLTPQDGNSWAVVSNLTLNSSQAESISANLAKRWTPFGAPAPEAADAVSPFISGFELQSHFLANNVTAALSLMRLQWGFMLDDPRMTNSTFIEGYSTTGALHYAPYRNDPRISHAHGWATGPTSSLTFYVAGIQLLSAGGQTWKIAPALGDLKVADAGFSTTLGFFSAKTQIKDKGLQLDFEAPEGTIGEVQIPSIGCAGKATLCAAGNGQEASSVDVKDNDASSRIIRDVKGGKWQVTFKCSG